MIAIDQALLDENLLGAALGPADTWQTWMCVLRAAFALPLDRKDRTTFAKIAGDRAPPRKPRRELWVIAGRRSGKSRMAAAIATYVATFLPHQLAKGEVGHVLVLSPTLAQSRTIFGYVEAFLQSSPILARKLRDVTASEIKLTGNIVIATHTNSYRSVRGRTLLAVVFDESAYWRDETSALPDIETYRAVIPALASSSGLLVGISSPYRRVGLLHQKHRDHYRQDGPVLVAVGGTETFNPTIDKRMIAQARSSDPQSAAAEWDAQFRSDLSQFIADEQIDGAVDHARPAELPPLPGTKYHCFVDASAGRGDHFTCAVGHRDGDRFVCDVLRGRKPPFDPASVAAEYAQLAKDYHCATVVGDAYAGEWVAAAFKKAGVDYRRSKQPRSVLYLESMPHFMRGAVSIPDHSRLLRELRLLERRTAPSGKDTIDHGRNGSDDYANALCGAIRHSMKEPRECVAELTGGCKLFDTRTGAQIGGLQAPCVLPSTPHAIPEHVLRRADALRAQGYGQPATNKVEFFGKMFSSGASR